MQGYGILLTRAALGVIVLAHGLLKVFVFTIPGTVGFFESLGLPGFVAYLVIFGEIAGGAALILGLYTRLAAFLLIPILAGAAWAHSNNGWVFSNEGGGWEFPVYLTFMALAVHLLGSGPYAIQKLPVFDKFIPNFFRG